MIVYVEQRQSYIDLPYECVVSTVEIQRGENKVNTLIAGMILERLTLSIIS